jgi:hypothetical protein
MKRRVLVAIFLVTALSGALAPEAGASQNVAQITVRQFCQTQDGFAVYLAVHGTGFPTNTEGTFRVGSDLTFPVATDERGDVETSLGFGLSGLDDPLLGQSKDVTVEVGGVAVTQTVTLTCDPAANAPVSKEECRVEVFRFFFDFLGFPFVNQGDCVAYVATGSTNPPG